MIDKNALHQDLITKFAQYQYRLDNPMPSTTETMETIQLVYLSDPMFRAKVDSLAAAVMVIIDHHDKPLGVTYKYPI